MIGAALGGRQWKELNEGLYHHWLRNTPGERNGVSIKGKKEGC